MKSIKEILNNDIGVNGFIYSPIFGKLKYLGEDDGLKFLCYISQKIVRFREDGTYADGGNILLYPSEENSNWENVPIKYPKNSEEMFSILSQNKDTMEKVQKALKNKENGLYYMYLRIVADFLDNMAGKIDVQKYPNGKNWIVTPEIDRETHVFFKWVVVRKVQPFYHFGFYRKEAAEIFIKLMENEINIWSFQVYQRDIPQIRNLWR